MAFLLFSKHESFVIVSMITRPKPHCKGLAHGLSLLFLDLYSFHLKAGDPGVFHVIDADLIRDHHPLRRVVHLPQFALLPLISFRHHGFLILVGKTYRHLQIRRRTSAGDLLHAQHHVLKPLAAHIGHGRLVHLYHKSHSFFFGN